ncbi:MAG: hypothetical protein ACP5VP_09030 [Candidatus Limnocylindrales bacterium]
MNDQYAWWFLVVGLAVGGALVWVVRGQMAREEDDVADSERAPEAEWISQAIERAGGIAPADLVAQVLLLHRSYLREADPFEPPLGDDAATDGASDHPESFGPLPDAQAADVPPLSRGEGPSPGGSPRHRS